MAEAKKKVDAVIVGMGWTGAIMAKVDSMAAGICVSIWYS